MQTSETNSTDDCPTNLILPERNEVHWRCQIFQIHFEHTDEEQICGVVLCWFCKYELADLERKVVSGRKTWLRSAVKHSIFPRRLEISSCSSVATLCAVSDSLSCLPCVSRSSGISFKRAGKASLRAFNSSPCVVHSCLRSIPALVSLSTCIDIQHHHWTEMQKNFSSSQGCNKQKSVARKGFELHLWMSWSTDVSLSLSRSLSLSVCKTRETKLQSADEEGLRIVST